MRRLIPGRDPVLAESAQVTAFARSLALALARTVAPPAPVAVLLRPKAVIAPEQSTTPLAPEPSNKPYPPELPTTPQEPGPSTAPEAWSAPTAASVPRDVTAAHLDIDELWRAYSADRTRPQRDRLLVHYTPLVRAVANRMAGGLPSSVDLADLVQSGVFGLIDAVERFDPRLGPRFESYADPRIRGAMLDELRAQDWVPRSVRSRAREFERVQERLEGRMGRAATDRELAEEMGIPVRELHSTAQHVQLVSVEAWGDGAGGDSELLADDAIPDPMAVVQRQETSRQLSAAVGQLGERDRLVIQLYYLENRTLAEIGRLLGVTESRVCQLHSRLVVRLRGWLEEFATG